MSETSEPAHPEEADDSPTEDHMSETPMTDTDRRTEPAPQPFTWDDVYLLRQIATYLDTPEVTASEDGWALDALADRLAALLPPR